MQTIVAAIVSSIILVGTPAAPATQSVTPHSIGTVICRTFPILCR